MPRPRKEQSKLVQTDLALGKHELFSSIAEDLGVSLRKLTEMACDLLIEEYRGKVETTYTIGSIVDSHQLSLWELQDEVVLANTTNNYGKQMVDRNVFAAKGFMWVALRRNGAATKYVAEVELPDELLRAYHKLYSSYRSMKVLYQAVKGYSDISSKPRYADLPFDSGDLNKVGLATGYIESLAYKKQDPDFKEALDQLDTMSIDDTLDQLIEQVEQEELPEEQPEVTIEHEVAIDLPRNVPVAIKKLANTFGLDKATIKTLGVGDSIPVTGGYIVRTKDACYEYRLEPAVV